MDDIRKQLIIIYNTDRHYHNNAAFRVLVDYIYRTNRAKNLSVELTTTYRREELPDFITPTKSETYLPKTLNCKKTPGSSSRFFNMFKIIVLQGIKRLSCRNAGKNFPILLKHINKKWFKLHQNSN